MALSKGNVESGVKYVRRHFWQSLVSISGVDDLNSRCREWLNNVANTWVHGTTGRVPFEMLKEEGLQPVAGGSPYPACPAGNFKSPKMGEIKTPLTRGNFREN